MNEKTTSIYRKPGTRPKGLVRLGVFVEKELRAAVKRAALDAGLTMEAWMTEAAEAKLAKVEAKKEVAS